MRLYIVVIELTKPLVIQQECAEVLTWAQNDMLSPEEKNTRKPNVGHKPFLSHWEDFARQNMTQDTTEGHRQ